MKYFWAVMFVLSCAAGYESLPQDKEALRLTFMAISLATASILWKLDERTPDEG